MKNKIFKDGKYKIADEKEEKEIEERFDRFRKEDPDLSFSLLQFSAQREVIESNERERRDILILAIQELDKRNLSNTRFRHIVDCMLNHDYSYKSACKDADKVESSPNCWFREN